MIGISIAIVLHAFIALTYSPPFQINTGMTEADGVSGPLIVHPKKPPTYEYDEDVVVFLQDFYSVTAEQQQVGLMSFPFVWMVSLQLLRGRHDVLN